MILSVYQRGWPHKIYEVREIRARDVHKHLVKAGIPRPASRDLLPELMNHLRATYRTWRIELIL